MILAQRAVAREHVAQRVVLPLQRVGRRNAGEAAEFVLRHDSNRSVGARLRVQLLGALQLVRLVVVVARRRTESFRADDEQRRLPVHLVGGCAAQTLDERARVPAAQ